MTPSFDPAGPRAASLPTSAALRVFLAVAQSGSTAKAATLVHLTQGAVSKQVRALEILLGVALFERHAGGAGGTARLAIGFTHHSYRSAQARGLGLTSLCLLADA